MSFRITGLPTAGFADLFRLPDAELRARQALRCRVDRAHGYPCRVSLTDAEPGEEVILTHYQHHDVDSPFRASFAIYVREGEQQFDEIDQVPQQLRRRMLSLRGFDAQGLMVDCSLTAGAEMEQAVEALLANDRISYVHAHFAAAGCYAARIERAA